MKNSIQLHLDSNLHKIKDLEEKIRNFLISNGFSDAAVQIQIMIIKELITNGLKYGKAASSENRISVGIHLDERTITFEVQNPVDATCFDRLKELDTTIQFIRGYQDPFEAYLIKQQEVSRNPHGDKRNGLGLARIAYEGDAMLDFFISEDSTLNLYAVKNLDDNFQNGHWTANTA